MTNSFSDKHGRVWTPEVTTPVLLEVCRKLKIKLADVMNLDIPIDGLFEFLWLACRKEAKERDVTKDAFFDALPPAALKDVFGAFFGAVGYSFPDTPESEGGDDDDGPFEESPGQ